MNSWQRGFVWTVGGIHIASSIFLMMFLGAIDRDVPDPTRLEDALLGLTVALGLHGALMLAPLVVGARPLYRAVTAAAMLPGASLQALVLAQYIADLQYSSAMLWTPGAGLALTGTAAYAAQFYWLARSRRPTLSRAAA